MTVSVPPRSRIKNLLQSPAPQEGVLVQGWVRTRRDSRDLSFLEINDGSCLANLQAVVQASPEDSLRIRELTTGSAASFLGDLVYSQGRGQTYELQVREASLIGPAGPDYPLQKKRHSDEYLREIAHLRPRTGKFGAMLRLRSECSLAVHQFFRERGFFLVHTPIITGSDCEGAGEMFQVTTLKDTAADPAFKEDFFGRYAALTVSGQLEAELLALALGRVYTFGPAFRAENSNTSRHAAEFWMIEPEAAFFDLEDDMDLAWELVRYLVRSALAGSEEDLALFDRFIEKGLLEHLRNLAEADCLRLPYEEAVRILAASGRRFEHEPVFGSDLATEHERFLCEEHFKGPVIVFNYPKAIKPFYMKANDDGLTAAAMDLLVPRVGELIGGSQREERLPVLLERMREMKMNEEAYGWYLDSRRWGSVPHAGFGLGFERFLMMLTGLANIRDVIAFPRTPKNLAF
ncbi:MAG: asparagine--tRNA ligase [Deltaproteobacteria bacterium]|jgi:asparaginyl-tRNA synthetase|nr:asparagine--tRNA ligase [Deltaproteobacteria bacterium]